MHHTLLYIPSLRPFRWLCCGLVMLPAPTLAQNMSLSGSFDFGRFVVLETGTGATVTIDSSGNRSVGNSSKIALVSGTISRPAATITGANNAVCSLASSGGPLTGVTPIFPSSVTLDSNGTASILIGGTLSIGSSVPSAGLKSGTVTVSVTCLSP